MKKKPCGLLIALFWVANLHSIFAQNTAFFMSSSPVVGLGPECVIAADVNGDGKLDLISANYYDGKLGVLTNDGSGGFVLASSPKVYNTYSVCAADVNGDGKLDLISANSGENTLTILTNAAIFPAPTSTPPLVIATLALGIQVSWPSASPGWSLQQNSDLTAANWGPSGYNGFSISDDGTNNSLTLPTTQGNLFFRLLHP
jgi:hypothetical protein